jgi:hypothetical protein
VKSGIRATAQAEKAHVRLWSQCCQEVGYVNIDSQGRNMSGGEVPTGKAALVQRL